MLPPLLVLLALQPPTPDEARRSDRIRQGDHAAFRAFFDAHHGRLLAFLQHRGVPPAVADDLAQQAFVYVWEQRARIEPGRSLRAYLFRIAYTRALNHFRDTARFDDALPDVLPASAPGGDAASLALVEEAVRAAIAELPEKRRAVFELCFLQELTHREAADVLGISPKTVEHQMGHALKHLRARLQPYLE